MPTKFPKGFKCPQQLNEMYPEIEQRMLPLIRVKARKLRRLSGFDFEDAVQEGRIALLNALVRYDFNRGKGGLERYVGVVLTNTYNALLYESMAQCRMPQVVIQENGHWVKVPRPPVSLDGLLGFDPADGRNNPEETLQQAQMEDSARLFRLRMFNSLKGRDLDVFVCKVNPPMGLLIMIRNLGGDYQNPTNLHIAKYLDINKNAVDWSLYKIRSKFTELCQYREFSELLGKVVKGRGWSMIHASWESKHDVVFIQETIEKRGLEPRPNKNCHQELDYLQKSGDDVRLIERYSWGICMFLKYKGQHCTLVIEGHFNPRNGEVRGQQGGQEIIPVSWYKQLVKKLMKTNE